MNSSFFFFLLHLLLLASISFPNPSFAIKPRINQVITEQEASRNHQHVLGRGNVQRKLLHEVHSGPNPIGNSIPQKKWKSSTQRNP
ncbi:hypothetical protein QN277_008914 [Acacia crassicarpa]|uniref:Uncharacterized protein n=1 Tax=Acacia crassicarpa TaxID=499986 RepID=A0AAE1ISL1_9FABA|nr:hypothetical protein QN277_008914 [Acacia crassicarpa]